MTRPRTAWLAFAVLGAIDAVVLLEFPIAGLLVAALAVAGIAARPPRAAAVAGLVTGLGASWTLLIGRVWVTCTGFDPRTGETCEAPGIEPWLLLGAAIVAVGMAASLAVVFARWRGERL